MPPKYHNDEYDRCLHSTTDLAIFCGVKTIIKPAPNNEIWKIIEVTFSSTFMRSLDRRFPVFFKGLFFR